MKFFTEKLSAYFLVFALLIQVKIGVVAAPQIIAPANVQNAELKREIGELRQIAVKKVNDADIIADGFTNSEAIMRRLRLAYTFKAALNSISDGFGLVAGVSDAKGIKDVFLKEVKSPTEWASLGLAIDNVVENGDKLAFVFNGTSFVAGVDEMIKTAKSSQPPVGFDESLYRSSIEQSLFGFDNQNIVVASHKKSLEPCQIIKPRGEKFERVGSFKNLNEIRRYLSDELRQIETEVDGKNYTPQQIASLVALVKQAKTVLLESKLRSTSINSTLPASLATSNCKANKTQISLGRIATQQTLLTTTYDAFDKKLAIEQILTLKSAADGVSSATHVFLAGQKGSETQRKVLDVVSKFSLSADIGVWTAQRIFQTEPEKMIADVPQLMLVDLPQESANAVLLIDTLKSFFAYAAGRPTTPKIPPVIPAAPEIPTLFLFDVSGSMLDDDKIGQSRNSSLLALREIQENKRLGRGDASVSVWAFSGECTTSAARQILPFTANLTEAENTLASQIPRSDGGTPLPQAINAAKNQVSGYLNSRPQLNEARIILLSDGQSTCGEIRPAGIYSQAKTITVKNVRFLTIGFDVPAGSAAERDLQFLASASGGQYFPAQNQQQLVRAFEKTIRVYQPKILPNISAEFQNAARAILNRDFETARKLGGEYVRNNPSDPFGYYNFAVALEVSSRYKGAADNYRKYLQLAPAAADRREIETRVEKLEQDYRDKFFTTEIF